jgi:uncharacterized protein (TIGR02099 family)
MQKFSKYFARYCTHFVKRVLWIGGIMALFAVMGVVLLSRYWLLPNIERYHDQVAYAVGNAVGQPALIGRIEADWEGLRPHLLMINVRFLDQQGKVTLTLEKVESEVAWTSLFTGSLRLYSLVLDQPNLTVRRDAQGEVSVAGMQMSRAPVSGASSGGSAADWLLNQSRIEVRDARITWLDEKRATPPLVFNEVNLLIENGWWRRHRFAFRAMPPKELSAQLDVRGDFSGASFSDTDAWEGQLFTQLDYADVAAWRKWMTLPVPLGSGKGAVRGWLDVEGGKISQVTADLALSNVRTRMAEDLPLIDLRTLQGRVGWRDAERGMEISTRKLSLRMRKGYALPPTDFYLRYDVALDQGLASGEVRANELDLLGLTTLSEYLPFNRGFKRKLAAFDPRGKVTDLRAEWNWQRDADKLLRFKLQAKFDSMALSPVDGVPGFSGLSGKVDGSEEGGTLSLGSHKLMVNAPGIMQEKLLFDTLSGQVGWQEGKQGMEVSFNNVIIANQDVEGVLGGSYRTLPEGPGAVDLSAHLTRAMARHVDRYIPIGALGKDVHAWLASGLLSGHSDDVSVRLSGDLSKFPFPDSRDGVFQIKAEVQDATVEFLKEWPRIENIGGMLLIDGKRLEVSAQSATTGGNALRNFRVVIPDLVSQEPMIQVEGVAQGEAGRSLEYIRKSPVRGMLGGFFDNASATGNGELTLKLEIPLAGARPVKVGGNYRLQGCDVDLGDGIPMLRQASGDIAFTESSVASHNLAAATVGGPATMEITSGDGGRLIRAKASGRADMDAWRRENPHPLLRYLHGGSPWELAVTVQDGRADIQFASSLTGLVSDLPAPFAKRADEKSPLRFSQTIQGGKQALSLQYGDLLNAQVSRVKEEGAWKVQSGVVVFGQQKFWPEREGLWLVGEIPHLSLVGWTPLLGMMKGEGSEPGSDIGFKGANLLIRKVTGYSQSANNLRISSRVRNSEVFAQLNSEEISGGVVWQPQGKDAMATCLRNTGIPFSKKADGESGGGKLAICLSNLALTHGGRTGGEKTSGKPAEDEGEGKPVAAADEKNDGESPEIHLVAANLTYQGKPLGELDIQAKQSGGDWLLDHVLLDIKRGDIKGGRLTADGKWLTTSPLPQTQLNFKLVIYNSGEVLTNSGYPGSVEKGGGSLEGSLSWPGDPGDFNYNALGGTLKLDVNEGQFLKIDPEVSGLLRILSLQAFSFADAFKKGFAFKKIKGTAKIRQGVLITEDFKIESSAATVKMSGQVDLNNEKQDLKIVFEPALGGSAFIIVSVATTPIGGAIFWIVDKLFKGPVEKMASVEYKVTGSWKAPEFNKVGERKAAATDGK